MKCISRCPPYSSSLKIHIFANSLEVGIFLCLWVNHIINLLPGTFAVKRRSMLVEPFPSYCLTRKEQNLHKTSCTSLFTSQRLRGPLFPDAELQLWSFGCVP